MNNFILALALFAPLSPTIFSQPLVIVSFFLIIVNRYNSYVLNSYLGFKIISTACFSFGIVNGFAMEPSILIRFIPLLYLIWFYPYFNNYELSASFFKKVTFGIILIMILSQFLLAFQEPLTVALRETFYPIQENVWNERAVFSRLSSDAFTLFRGFRLGGFWYNPNVFASNLFLIYVVFYSSSRYLLSIKNKFKKRSGKVTFLGCSFLVFLSLLSSGSRSFIVGFILLILISNKKYFLKIASLKGSFFSSLIFLTISTFIVLFNFIASLFQAFSTGGSFDTKLSILKNYHLNSADFLTIFTGAGFIGFPFDFEYSYWFVLGGLFSLLGLIIFYIRISAYRSLNFLFLTIPLLLAGIGNSILFGLMSGSLLIPVLIIVYSLEYRKNIYLPLEK